MNATTTLRVFALPCLFTFFAAAGSARADAPFGIFFSGPDANTTVIAECIPQTFEVTRPLPFRVYDASQPGGVNVATGDVTGDGRAEIITGSGPGGGGRVRIYDGISQSMLGGFQLSGMAFNGGVNVAVGDVNGDGRADIVTGAGGGPQVRVFNGNGFAQLTAFDAYPVNFTGGVRVAAGDLDGDGKADIITGTGPGGSAEVKAFKGSNFSLLHQFSPFPASYTGGVHVAGGEFDGTGNADIVVVPGFDRALQEVTFFHGQTLAQLRSFPLPVAPPVGGAPVAVRDWNNDGFGDLTIVLKYTLRSLSGKDGEILHGFPLGSSGGGFEFDVGTRPIAVGNVKGGTAPHIVIGSGEFPLVQVLTPNFAQRFFGKFPKGSVFPGGVRVACGDVNADGKFDMIMGAGTAGGGDVAVCNGTDGGLLDFFAAFAPPTVFPIYVGAGDVNGDGRDDVIASIGQGGGPQVKVFNSTNRAVLHSFFAFDPLFTGGVRVASADFNKDGIDDIVTATGPGGPSQVKVFQGGSLSVIRNFAPEVAAFTGGVFVAAEDFNGDGVPDIVTGAGSGAPTVRLFDGVTSMQLAAFFAYEPAFTGGVRVATGDVNADGIPEIVTSPGPGRAPEVRSFAYPGLAKVHSFLPYPATFTSGVFISSWSPPQPNLRQHTIRRGSTGKLDIVFEERRGRTLYVDSTQNLIDWSQVLSTPATGTPFTFTADIVPGSMTIFRGRSQ